MVADAADMASVPTAFEAVLQQCRLERRIAPGLGDDAGADAMGADPGLIGLDDGVERGRLHIAFFGKDRRKRAHAQLGLRQLGMVVIVPMMMLFLATGANIVPESGRCRGEDSANIAAWAGLQGTGITAAIAALAHRGGMMRAPRMAPMRSMPPTFPRLAPGKVESWMSAATNTDFSAVANPSCVCSTSLQGRSS